MKTSLILVVMITATFVAASVAAPITAQVVTVYPPQNAVSVPVGDSLVIRFAPELNILPQSLSDTTFVIEAQQSGWHRGTVTFDQPSNTLTFKPTKPFFVGELVTAVATKKIQYDSAGTVRNIRGFAWQFWGKVTAQSYGTMRLKNTIAAPQLNSVGALADIDNDGNLDLTTWFNDSDRVYMNTGGGIGFLELGLANRGPLFAFEYAGSQYKDLRGDDTYFRNVDGQHFLMSGPQGHQFTGGFPISFDANCDGFPDQFGRGVADSMLLLLFSDTITLDARSTQLSSTPYWSTAFDANNDGALDVVVQTSAGLMLLVNDGDGHFGAPRLISAAGEGGDNIRGGDFDDDGWCDLLAVTTGHMHLYHNNHDGTFTKRDLHIDVFPDLGNNYGLTVGDLDGNGKLDAAFTMSARRLTDSIYVISSLNDGTGQFHIAQIWRAAGPDEAYLQCGDLSGDGTLDVVMAYSAAQSVLIFHNDSTVHPVGVGEAPAAGPQTIALSDVYPEPVTNTASVTFFLPTAQHVQVTLCNVAGEVLGNLANGPATEGLHTISYDCGRLQSGAYFAELSSPRFHGTRPLIVQH